MFGEGARLYEVLRRQPIRRLAGYKSGLICMIRTAEPFQSLTPSDPSATYRKPQLSVLDRCREYSTSWHFRIPRSSVLVLCRAYSIPSNYISRIVSTRFFPSVLSSLSRIFRKPISVWTAITRPAQRTDLCQLKLTPTDELPRCANRVPSSEPALRVQTPQSMRPVRGPLRHTASQSQSHRPSISRCTHLLREIVPKTAWK